VFTARKTYSTVSIYNDYDWILDPKLAKFIVLVDGKKLGKVTVGQWLDLSLPAGSHVFRIKLWKWFMSPRLELHLTPGAKVSIRAGHDRTMSVVQRLKLAYVHPRTLFILEPLSSVSAPQVDRATHSIDTASRGSSFRKIAVMSGTISFIGFLEMLLNDKTVVGIAIGAAIAISGTIFGCLKLRKM
jgi:hypothetical protein